MRLLTPLTVFVVAILTSQVRTEAEDGNAAMSTPIHPVTTSGSLQPLSQNGFDQYRQQPDLGAPSSPSFGFRHFPLPMHMFTTWHRPRAATLTKGQRCAPDAFRPRGFGNLFARPCDSFRMEYTPYTLYGDQSKYGPSYLLRQNDQRCDDCNQHHHHH